MNDEGVAHARSCWPPRCSSSWARSSEEEFVELERDILARLREIRERRAGRGRRGLSGQTRLRGGGQLSAARARIRRPGRPLPLSCKPLASASSGARAAWARPPAPRPRRSIWRKTSRKKLLQALDQAPPAAVFDRATPQAASSSSPPIPPILSATPWRPGSDPSRGASPPARGVLWAAGARRRRRPRALAGSAAGALASTIAAARHLPRSRGRGPLPLLTLPGRGRADRPGRAGAAGAARAGCGEVVVDTAPTGPYPAPARHAGGAAALRGRSSTTCRTSTAFSARVSAAAISRTRPTGRSPASKRRGAEIAALLRRSRPGRLRLGDCCRRPSSLAETRDGLAALDAAGIAVREVIVNRVLPPPPELRQARPTPRRQAPSWQALAERVRCFPGASVRMFSEQRARAARAWRPCGGLARRFSAPGTRRPSSPPSGPAGERPSQPPAAPSRLPGSIRDLLRSRRACGSCCSAARAAWGRRPARRRRRWPWPPPAGARVLLLSTDPAHSLADVLGVELGDEERPVPGAPPGCARASSTPSSPSGAGGPAPGTASMRLSRP